MHVNPTCKQNFVLQSSPYRPDHDANDFRLADSVGRSLNHDPEGLAQRRQAAKGPIGAGISDENEIAARIVDAAFKVHTALGPGLLESVYDVVLAHEIIKRGLSVRRQV